jgi:Uma2 family endonuclease
MTTLTHPPIPFVPAPPRQRDEQRFVLHNVAWASYLSVGRLFADRPALRITYDRGTLEFMTTSPRHERYKYWLGRLVDIIAEELNKPFVPGGSMTFQREDVERGFELDQCYWIANELAVRAKMTWEPALDPPPDLAIEIEVSRSALNRMAIFAAFRIPEVWCYDGEELRVYLLHTEGTYQRGEHSRAFPSIPMHELVSLMASFETTDYLSAVASVRTWARSLISKSP